MCHACSNIYISISFAPSRQQNLFNIFLILGAKILSSKILLAGQTKSTYSRKIIKN